MITASVFYAAVLSCPVSSPSARTRALLAVGGGAGDCAQLAYRMLDGGLAIVALHEQFRAGDNDAFVARYNEDLGLEGARAVGGTDDDWA